MSLCGIYCYVDSKDNSVVYVGKDSYIHKNKRHHDHLQQGQYYRQHINKVLQNNPDRYHYKILSVFNPQHKPKELLNALEMSFINFFKPIFNFTLGGDGSTGLKHSEESKKKISDANKGRLKGIPRPPFSEEHKKSLSLNHADVKGENNPAYVFHARIVKAGIVNGKQRYMIKRKGKKIKFSVCYDTLVDWFKENYPNEYLDY